MDAITVTDLVRGYGTVRAVDGVSFSVGHGEIFALLGPNGAGKTTTVEILEGFRTRDSGEVRVLGQDPATGGRGFRERIGIVLQSAGFEEEFTVRELLRLQATLYPRRHDPDELIGLVELVDKRNTRVKALSGGQRRRLDLALGLVGAPELLFLDEPTTGFDPAARHRAWALIGRLRDLGTTVLLTTHYLEEAQELADRVAVLRSGRLVAIGSPDELRGDGGAPATISFTLPVGVGPGDLPSLSGEIHTGGHTARVRTHAGVVDLRALTGWAVEAGHGLDDLTVSPPTLEEAYLELTGEPGHDR
jgi:ABC-type multidrug transport system ATPase subunit